MSDLQADLETWDSLEEPPPAVVLRLVNAARKVANPNYEAARQFMVDQKINNMHMANWIVDAALGMEDTE